MWLSLLVPSPPFASHTAATDGTLAVLPAASDFLFVWSSVSKKAIKVALGPHIPQQEMMAAGWSADSTRLTVGTNKGSVVVLDMNTRRVLHNFPGIHENVRCHASHPHATLTPNGLVKT